MNKRLLNKLHEKLGEGDYYEAHQIYRTIYYRLLRDNKYPEIYNLLFDGAMKLFEKNENNSAADLANLIVETMSKVDSYDQLNHTENEIIENITTLFEKMLPDSPERIQFIAKLLKIPYISTADFRKKFAEVLWKEKNYSDARLHFIYSSDNGSNCALMLIEYQTKTAYPHEVDLVIAQFVLQVLCTENLQLAQNTFYYYSLNHPKIKCTKPSFTTPLLNFIFFLLTAINRFSGNSQLFNVLCHLYEKSLNRDPSYKDYLQHIGQQYFGVEKRSNNGGLFTNLLQSLFDSPDDGTNNNGNNSFNINNTMTFSDGNHDVDLD